MIKIRCLIFLLIPLLVGCSDQYDYSASKNNILIYYTPYIQINFNTGLININLSKNYSYKGTIHFTKQDRASIIEAYNSKGIGQFKNWHIYDAGHSIPHNDAFKLKVYNDGKLRSEFIMAYDADYSKLWPFGDRYNLLSFRQEILKALSNKPELKEAIAVQQAFFEYVRKKSLKDGKRESVK